MISDWLSSGSINVLAIEMEYDPPNDLRKIEASERCSGIV
jgi:hypothetical protein